MIKIEMISWFVFDDCALEYVSQHKHLEVTSSSNLNWPNHIYTVIKKNFKKLVYVKKFFVSRDILAQMYIIFVRPLVGCTV